MAPSKPKLRVVKDPDMLDFRDDELLFAQNEEEEGGEEGGEGGEGGWDTTGPLIDPAIFGFTNHDFLELIRHEERKFSDGWVPVTKDPPLENNQTGMDNHYGPPPHPLLSQSSQFSGDDKKVTANPVESEPGAENYEELRNDLKPGARPTHLPKPSTAPTLKPYH